MRIIKNPKKRANYFMFVLFVLMAILAVGIFGVQVYKMFRETKTKIVAENDTAPVRDSIDDYDSANEQRKKDYENGETALGGDNDIVLAEGDVDSEDNMMCQDYYDNDGNLIWKGITIKEAKNADSELMQKFNDALDAWTAATSEATENTKLNIVDSGKRRDILRNLCVSYDETIAYADNLFDYYKGYTKDENGYDNIPFIKEGQYGFGMCSLGYVTWCMRNTFGYTPKALKGRKLHTDRAEKVNIRNLQIGDIAVCKEESGGILYGVICGTYKKNHIVSMCDSTSTELFPAGCNHLCYIERETDSVLGGYRAVRFTEFYHLKEKWEGSEQ